MIEEVRACVSARADFFGKYVTAPPALQPEVNSFLARLHGLGERCGNAAEFEQQFQATGLMAEFNALVTRCTPQAYQMTAQDKAYSRQVARDIFEEDKGRILKEAGQDALESVTMKAESDLRAQRIRQMSDAGVLDDYTKASNAVEDLGILARLFRRKKG